MPLRHDMRRGAACMLAATALFAAMNVFVKLASEELHFLQVMFFRSALAVPVVLLIVLRTRDGATLRTKRPWQHVLRAATGTTAMACSFFALSVLPLAEQTALTYTTPVFVTLLAIPFLGEKVGVHRFGAVAGGFLGIMVIALGKGAFGGEVTRAAAMGMAAAVAHGVFSAATTLLVRSLSSTERSGTIVLWQSLLMTGFTGLAMPFVWVNPSMEGWLLLLATGIIGGVAQVLLTEAYASAQVSALGAFSYSGILWSILLGLLVFGDQPTLWTLVGATLIVAAGLYIMHREMVRKIRR
ncbi:DMT family transporter [Sabulicella rubraurantiaca]|uniref:DMT family transporter n=1 Tax=Sabulicella rubraurantiaca TaxID=2811429 RepID=UPI001A95DB74|nr:DMT family transporter [Sabulicella rubraurantiaca]